MSKTRVLFAAILVAVPAVAGAQSMITAQLASAGTHELAIGLPDHGRAEEATAMAPSVRHPEWATGSLFEPAGHGRSLALVAAQVPASDPVSANRKGFIVGIGGGGAFHRSPAFSTLGQEWNFAVLTDFKIGYAATDQVLLHYSNRVAFTTAAAYDVVGVTGFGTTYMFKPTTPSAFVNGAVGFAVGGDIINTSSPDRGTGFSVGGGYEFRRRLSVDGTVMFVRLGNGRNHTVFAGALHFLYY